LIRRLAAALLVLTLGAAPHRDPAQKAVASLALPNLPILPGSVVPIALDGLTPPYDLDVLGPGRLRAGQYIVPSSPDDGATIVAAGVRALAMRSVTFAAPPDVRQPFIAVASYDDGIVLHDVTVPFKAHSILGVGGAPSDVAIDPAGSIAAAATNGVTAAIATLEPWHVTTYSGVPYTDEIAFDNATHSLFTSNRDINGAGAVTRIAPDGTIRQRVIGLTAEGIAVDSRRKRVYVANVNDGTISIVDANSLVELRRFNAVPRVFSLALSNDGSRLYAVSNQSLTSPFGAAGSAIAIDVSQEVPKIVARSRSMTFPLGVAVDDAHHRLFVTDEHDDDVYVLNMQNLQPVRAPLPTCRTPWKPTLDGGRLYVPCARSDNVDVIDAATLKRVPGAPFATGGYPLAVAVWHPPTAVKR
jgi:YVTN family beta-propeller protein